MEFPKSSGFFGLLTKSVWSDQIMSNQIRIVFIGDGMILRMVAFMISRCGKSSLIDSILYSTFEEDCPTSISEPMIQIGEKDPINIILNDTCCKI